MAGTNRIIASIYRLGSGYDFPGATGRLNNFPGSLTRMYPLTPTEVTGGGVTLQTVIELLPSGLQTPGTAALKFYAAADVATIQTAST